MAAGIYVHIPFCKQKCFYCDFVSGQGNDEDMELYQKALLNEIESTDINESVDSVFFGGGTPSVYKTEYIEEIIKLLEKRFNINLEKCEITIEANPGTVNYEKLLRYRNSGINRLSMGLQSANDEELKLLGRIHTFDEFVKNYYNARKAGFENINVDLISAIPKQTVKSYVKTLDVVTSLEPEHISAYSLIIEEGTLFYGKYSEGMPYEKDIPDEDEDRLMYHETKRILAGKGYDRYEISNYSKAGYECRHNIKYWSRDNYYGFGVAAASLVNNLRYTNLFDRNMYIEKKGCLNFIRRNYEKVDLNGQIEEYMFLGLRKTAGISLNDFKTEFEKSLEEIYGNTIQELCKTGLCEYMDGHFRLTEYGLDVSNIVFTKLISPLS